MDYEYENEQTVGAGIKTICILHFIFGGFAIIGCFLAMAVLTPELQSQTKVSTGMLILSLTSVVVLIVAAILILLKKKVGVFLYFGIVIINFIINIMNSANIFTLISSLILPILMAVFISKKKELYGLDKK